jgi:hypothetical protein
MGESAASGVLSAEVIGDVCGSVDGGSVSMEEVTWQS